VAKGGKLLRELSKTAYGGIEGKNYVPYEDGRHSKAGNLIVLVLGILLAILFAASTAYSGMKAGLTVAAGIPGAILGSGLLTIFIRKNNFLMKNILQSMATGGESIASGLIFVLPSLILIGGQVNFFQGVIVGIAGVLFSIGVLAFIQDYLLIEEHGLLVYPESMAISETLVASDTGGDSLKFMGIGFAIGGIITLLTSGFFGIVNNYISYINERTYKWRFEMEVNPMLLGIGFIVGMKISVTMFAGSILANFAIVPLIGYLAGMASEGQTVWNDATTPLNQMTVAQISGSYARYIGAGMMISGGIIGAVKLIPTIVQSVRNTLAARRGAVQGERDSAGIISLFVGVIIAFVFGFVFTGNFLMAIVGAILALILSMLFVIVAGGLTGTIGTSNLPVSGMTIASLVILSLVFLIMGWTTDGNIQSLLLFGTFIVVAISVGGGYSQAQKVTFITGGNMSEVRKFFIVAGIIGVVTVVGVITLLRDQLAYVGDSPPFALPQANLMATLSQGIIHGDLPWNTIIVGAVMGIVMQMLGLSIMTVAIGFYLPIATTAIVLAGALVRYFVEKFGDRDALDERISSGVSLSSGLVAGCSIIGLIGIILQVTHVIEPGSPTGFMGGNTIAWILLALLVIAFVLPLMGVKRKSVPMDNCE